MRFSTHPHPVYSGLDWQARPMDVCLLSQEGAIRLHRHMQAAPEPFLRFLFRALTFHTGAIEEPMFQEYLRAFTLPGTIRAGLEDYRAAATRDFEDDERDLNKRLRCPVLAIWGEFGKMHTIFDVPIKVINRLQPVCSTDLIHAAIRAMALE